jgi:hypothetical protein
MTYGDIVLSRLEQTCNVLNQIDILFEKKTEDAHVDGNSLKKLELIYRRSKLYEYLLHYTNQQLDLINLRLNVIRSNDSKELRNNLEMYNSFLRELNKEYDIFDEPGVKYIL